MNDLLGSWGPTINIPYWEWIGEVVKAIVAHPSIAGTEIENIINGLSPAQIASLWPTQFPAANVVPTLPTWLTDARAAWHSGEQQASPLVLDLTATHTGIALTTFNASTNTTFFDIDNSGFATQTAWVGADMGLLCRDLNSNGRIDNAGELFGSTTVDGFALLSQLDSNGDHRIDQYDSAWSTLKIWVDANGDAVTDSGELHTLSSLNVASIDLASVAASTSTISGNAISHTGTFTFTSGATATIDDVWFTHDTTNSYYAGDYTLDTETLFLPTLRGFGTLADLAIAESQNSTLLGLVEDFATNFTLGSFADPATLDADVTAILREWAGVSSMDPDDRANGNAVTVDARDLTFLEKLFGETFAQTGTPGGINSYPLHFAGQIEESTWNDVRDWFKAQLLVQVGAEALFDSTVTYNPSSGTIDGTLHLSQTAIADLATNDAPGTDADAQAFWVSIANFIDHSEGITNLDSNELSWLNSAVTSTTSVAWSDIVDQYVHTNPGVYYTGTSGSDTYTGTNGDDTIYGYGGADTLNGGAGNDLIVEAYSVNGAVIHGGDGDDNIQVISGANTLYGDAGNDTIFGGSDSDTIDGGTGGNFLHGGAGNDTYVFSGGDDVIIEFTGTDQIVLPAGITLGDLTFTKVSTQGSVTNFADLLITVAGGGSIQIQNQFAGSSYQVETLVFHDSSTLNLTTLTGYATELTNVDDGYSPGGTDDQIVHALAGNDFIQTGSGDDILDGGVGNDILHGQTGNDTYIASPGFDTVSDTGGFDIIQLPAGFTADDVHLLRHSDAPNDLEITIDGLGQIVVTNQFYYTGAQTIEQIKFSDNSTLDLTTHSIESVGTSGNETIYAITTGASANNIYDGRGGTDTISAGNGNDIYVYSTGHVTVWESGGSDTVKFGDAWSTSDISIYRGGLHGSDLVFEDTNGNTMTITGQFTGSSYAVEHATFADSTTLDLMTIAMETRGTSGNDALYYTAGSQADTIYGYAGDDQLYGGSGATTIYGGDGTDQLHAGTGDTTLSGGDGSDYLYGNTGTDTFLFLHGETGSDIIPNFSTTEGDKIDIHDLLVGYDPLTSAITDFVHITANSTDAILSVDANGAVGGANFTQIATLYNMGGSLAGHEADLLANGNLIAHAA
ncbi:MAG: calcium-binding protein [Mesorhizobium sp.]